MKAIVFEHWGRCYEMWCDEHSVQADPVTGFAPPRVVTPDREYAQKRVDSHNEKWHKETE